MRVRSLELRFLAVAVPESEWEEARSRSNRFAVAPGHVAGDVEVGSRKIPDFWLVDKQGEAKDIVEELK